MITPPSGVPRPSTLEVAGVLGLAATVRVLALILLDDPHLHDAEVYAEAGRRLLADGVLPVHNCMPLYPLVSGLTGGGLGTRLVDVALSVATAGLVHRLGWQLLGDRRAALLAGLAAALWPHLIYLSVVRLTETSFTFLVCLGLSLWLDRRILAGSIALALSVLLRPTFELLYPILAVAVAMGIHRGGLRLATRWLVVLGLAYAAVMSPWWAHNHARYGRFVRLHAGGGLVAYVGHHPDNVSGGGLSANPELDLSRFTAIDDPLARDRALRRAALEQVRGDPLRATRRVAVKALRLWRPWPNAAEFRSIPAIAASAVAMLPALLLAILHLALFTRRRWRVAAVLWLPLVWLTVVHVLTIASLRYRIPVEPMLILLAADAWILLQKRGFPGPGVTTSLSDSVR